MDFFRRLALQRHVRERRNMGRPRRPDRLAVCVRPYHLADWAGAVRPLGAS
jgi:hypothetical protein